jgi:hypothetical protein
MKGGGVVLPASVAGSVRQRHKRRSGEEFRVCCFPSKFL